MRVALVMVVGTFWCRDPTLGADLEAIVARMPDCPTQMSDWHFSGAFEGARMALALV